MLYPDDLIFERFIDVTREDLPDIDIDFNSDRRGEVLEYLVQKYGRDWVSSRRYALTRPTGKTETAPSVAVSGLRSRSRIRIRFARPHVRETGTTGPPGSPQG